MEKTQKRPALHKYIKARGSMVRENPEIERLAEVTGYTADWIYLVVIGRKVRPASSRWRWSVRSWGR